MRHDEPDLDPLPFDLPLDDGPGPAAPLPEAAQQRMIEAALARGLPRAGGGRRRGAWLAIAAAALVFVALPAGAALWRYVEAARASAPAPRSPPPPAAPTPDVELETVTSLAPEPEPEPRVAPEPPAARPPRARRPRRARRAPAPAPARAAPPPPSAEQMLDLASAARGARRWAEAVARYEALMRAYPKSAAAYVARVSAAGIELEHLDHPARAAALYRAAIRARRGGPLERDARWGLARALRATGDVAAEREELQRILRDYPGGSIATGAKARLEALEGGR